MIRVILYANTFSQIISLFYISLIGVMFLIKKKLDSAENHIFKKLLLVGFLSAILDIASIVWAFNSQDTFVATLFAKSYLLTIVGFCLLYTEYAIIITNSKSNSEQKLEQYKRMKSKVLGIFIAIATVIMIAPIYTYIQDTEIVYHYGAATIITYVITCLNIVIWIGLLSLGVKRIAPRKIFPIVAVVVVGGVATLIQMLYPDILLLTAAMIFSIMIMYFSVFNIENPDLEMIEEIKRARNEAVHASEAKTNFLSNMSHELRTPLNAILGFSQGLLEQELNDEAKEDVEDIITASESLLELVNEILDISKIESDKFEIVNVDYDVEKTYKYLVSMTEGRIGNKSLEFIHKYDDDIPPVLNGDCVRIKQIALNLLTNSVKYTKEGYVKLRMQYDKIDEECGYLVITVSDSGLGIKDEDKEKLFSKFSRLDSKKNINIEGTGLGLALTKRLVDLMGGEIKLDSKYGVGTTFTVRLKQNISEVKLSDIDDEEETINNEFTGHGEKILVVDDNQVNLKVASRLLKAYNVYLEYATSGRECIEKVVNGEKYDLILLDDQMPGMTGREVIKHLKNIVDFHIPTVALTANALSGMKEKYLKAGFDDYLSKPIDKKLLVDILVRFLGDDKDETTEDSQPEEIINDKVENEPLESSIELKETTNEEQEINKIDDYAQDEEDQEAIEEDQEEIEEDIPDFRMEEDSTKSSTDEEDEEKIEFLDSEVESKAEKSNKGNIDYLEANGIDFKSAISILGDVEVYNETAKDVLDEMDNKLADLEKYLENEDYQNYNIVSHALKGDARYMGMIRLTDIAYNHELAAKDENIEYIREHYQELVEEADKMREVLKNYLGI